MHHDNKFAFQQLAAVVRLHASLVSISAALQSVYLNCSALSQQVCQNSLPFAVLQLTPAAISGQTPTEIVTSTGQSVLSLPCARALLHMSADTHHWSAKRELARLRQSPVVFFKQVIGIHCRNTSKTCLRCLRTCWRTVQVLSIYNRMLFQLAVTSYSYHGIHWSASFGSRAGMGTSTHAPSSHTCCLPLRLQAAPAGMVSSSKDRWMPSPAGIQVQMQVEFANRYWVCSKSTRSVNLLKSCNSTVEPASGKQFH